MARCAGGRAATEGETQMVTLPHILPEAEQNVHRAPLNLIAAFVRESNWIEGIKRDPRPQEVNATANFFGLPGLCLKDLSALNRVLQPDAVLRNRVGLNVRVGDHIAPQGAPLIRNMADSIIQQIDGNESHPYQLHQKYETLHPFTDGNGRTGRALWAWQMIKYDYAPGINLGFLHAWYYQSLKFGRRE